MNLIFAAFTYQQPTHHMYIAINQSACTNDESQRNVNQTNTSVLNLVIPKKLKVARWISTLWQSYDHDEIEMTQERRYAWEKIFYRDHAFAYTNQGSVIY